MLHGLQGQKDEFFTTKGNGRPSLLPLWQVHESQIESPDIPIDSMVSKSMLFPYSATPPRFLCSRKVFVSSEWLVAIKRSLGNLWSLPPDHRLEFAFQNVDLQSSYNEKPSSSGTRDFRSPDAQLRALESGGGSFTVYDIDDNGESVQYCLRRKYSAADAEEIFLQIAPSIFSIAVSGTNLNTSFESPLQTAPWRRLMYGYITL